MVDLIKSFRYLNAPDTDFALPIKFCALITLVIGNVQDESRHLPREVTELRIKFFASILENADIMQTSLATQMLKTHAALAHFNAFNIKTILYILNSSRRLTNHASDNGLQGNAKLSCLSIQRVLIFHVGKSKLTPCCSC